MSQTLYQDVEPSVLDIAKSIELLIFDIDGVFSDGLIYMGNNGEELKTFHTRDGYGIKSIMNAGIEVAIITGRKSKIVENRMKSLGINIIYQGQEDKLKAYNEICQNLAISPSATGYVGDDLIDWPVMEKVALKVCVADGHPLLIKKANYITVMKGGHGAVREVCDLVLESRGELEQHKGLSI